MDNILNSPTSISEVIANKIKIFANDIDNSDNFNPSCVLMKASYLLTKLSSINAELQQLKMKLSASRNQTIQKRIKVLIKFSKKR
jgi:hypothetical protein